MTPIGEFSTYGPWLIDSQTCKPYTGKKVRLESMMNTRSTLRSNQTAVLIFCALVASALGACNLPGQVTEAPPVPTEQETEPPTEEPTEEVVVTEAEPVLTETEAPLGVYTLAVIVDLSSEPVTREQAQSAVDDASQIFQGLTGFGIEMVNFVEMTPEGSERRSDLPQRYIDTYEGQLPDGIVMFSFGNDDSAWLYGGYAGSVYITSGYANHFPIDGDPTLMTISTVHFSHRYAICGYDEETRTTVVSDVSVGGECRNQPGTPCVERYGYSMCSTAVDDLYASTPTYFVATSIVHEIAHPYGLHGTMDHYGTEICREEMGWDGTNWQFSLADSQEWVAMCPYVYERITQSYQP